LAVPPLPAESSGVPAAPAPLLPALPPKPLPALLPSPASPVDASEAGILLRSTSVMSVQLANATSAPMEASAKVNLTERIGDTAVYRE
jgi:hypothetical protein